MPRIFGIKAVSFDADGTLWDFEKVMRQSLALTLKELESMDPASAAGLDIEKLISIRNRTAEELKGKITNLERVRLEAFRRTLAESGRPDDALAAHLNDFYLKHRFDDIQLYEDVLPVLMALRTKYTVGLLSNGNSYPERCGLDGMFHYVVFSQDYGIEKPDPRIYQIAAQKAGCSLSEMVNVGDSIANDVVGPSLAGMQAVWLNRRGITPGPDEKIEHRISSLTELLDILE